MGPIDFQTALGRLLSNAALRAKFRADPAAVNNLLNVEPAARSALLELSSDQLERQAAVLLRKQLDSICRVLPQCCLHLGDKLWDRFSEFAAAKPHLNHLSPDPLFLTAPEESLSVLRKAFDFTVHLRSVCPAAVCESEVNRLRFALGRSVFRIHAVRDLGLDGREIPALQLFARWRGRWREIAIHFRVRA